jgi:uncharacterized membrane protein YsdA (DUF1294 family)
MQKQNALRSLNILHKALLMGQVFFAAVCVFIIYTKAAEPALKELEKVLQVVALVMTTGGIFAGMAVFKKKLLQIREMQADAEAKFSLYRSALILQWALLEGPSIFCIICFFITGNYAFIALAIVIMFVFVMTTPSKNKVLTQLQITEAELDEL